MELKNNAQRAQSILTIFYIMLAFTPIVIWSDYLQFQLVSGDFTTEGIESNDLRQMIVSIINICIYLLAVVFFIMWFRRAYYNLHQTEAKLEFTEGWAAGAWFVPLLNLVRPYQIMKEIWVKTQEQNGQTIKEPTTSLIGLWWGALILSNALTRISNKLYQKADTAAELADSTLATIGAEVMSIPPLILIIIIIKKVAEFEVDLYNNTNKVDLSAHLIK